MAGASPALLTCPQFCAGAAVARAAKNKHVGRNRFAYYTRPKCPYEYSSGNPCGRHIPCFDAAFALTEKKWFFSQNLSQLFHSIAVISVLNLKGAIR
jgi:hypothetical protein